MHICDICGTTVAYINENQVCKSCSTKTFTAVKQEVKKDVEDRDNQDYLLKFFNITLERFENVTTDNIADILVTDYHYKDAQRTLWHNYRENAFTKAGTMKKAVEKKIKAAADIVVVEKSEPKPIKRSAGKKLALDNAANARSTAKIFGAKALIGTAKQKSWGESLRKSFIENVEREDVLNAVLQNSIAQSSNFWIELRDCEHEDIAKVLLFELHHKQFAIQAQEVRFTKKLIDDYGRENRFVADKIEQVSRKYGVEL